MEHRPLVISNGQVKQLPAGDSVAGVATFLEPVVIAGFNTDVTYIASTAFVPMFVTTTDGDLVTTVTTGN